MNTPYSAKAENPALKEFLSLDMNSAGKLPFLSDCQKRRLFLLFFFVFMLLFPCFNTSSSVANHYVPIKMSPQVGGTNGVFTINKDRSFKESVTA